MGILKTYRNKSHRFSICKCLEQSVVGLSRRLFFAALVFSLLSAVGCKTLQKNTAPVFQSTLDPVKFFVGRTRSFGVVENKNGNPTARITTETNGVLKDGVLYIEQDLSTEGGIKNHRSWSLKQIDSQHVHAVANDIEGTAKGLLNGNHFSWTFRRKLPNRKFIRHLQMSQNMYLANDGQTMIVRSVLRKFLIVVAQITEQFSKN